ncbi:hypothetical protein KTR66_01915 [Roseococcus sp. SDR]|uniref:hypothetical protein n=1 Tax=Roseococcus sp. SDR TaxID=2835532 RepID=UPI001BD0F9C8|nr:hypothetical protein [Roseococcus sp. SDR]MBS7788730.1 hypothetical protein [Roseococcus sp. SDR]MBV1844044.1 hypothetical protein [Roseococcus sp. SDR]
MPIRRAIAPCLLIAGLALALAPAAEAGRAPMPCGPRVTAVFSSLQQAGTRFAYLIQLTAHESVHMRVTMTLPGADSVWPNGGRMVLLAGSSRKDVYAVWEGPRVSDAEMQARTTLMCD